MTSASYVPAVDKPTGAYGMYEMTRTKSTARKIKLMLDQRTDLSGLKVHVRARDAVIWPSSDTDYHTER